ncbi:sarcosine oxidase subunit gamma [Novispirillum sp. DQ9]|uniref:sarcosine oxidase subunit gamma n=1 Tax=Novispirillum sp. DQ9 TaxID=3398612 RepID=UPI003C7C5DB1
MPDLMLLTPLTALGRFEPRVDTVGSLCIAERPDVALASLARRRDKDTAAAETFLGVALPGVATWAGKDPFGVFWTGPGQWMVEAPFASHEDLAALLKHAVGDAASITEQTDAWVRFDVSGATTPALFERLCPLDLARLATGAAQRTTIEHLGCFVLCREAGRSYTVLGPRSSAASLHHALLTAARSIS